MVNWLLCGERDGLELAEAMRSVVPALVPIAITGMSGAAFSRSANASGIFAVLEEPFDLEQLCLAVRSVKL